MEQPFVGFEENLPFFVRQLVAELEYLYAVPEGDGVPHLVAYAFERFDVKPPLKGTAPKEAL